MYSLKRPCANCPFRKDLEINKGWLGKSAEGIIERLIKHREGFPCHKTVDYEALSIEEETGTRRSNSNEIQCAGAISLLKQSKEPNQAMQVAQRLGMEKMLGLDTVEISDNVVDTADEFIELHRN